MKYCQKLLNTISNTTHKLVLQPSTLLTFTKFAFMYIDIGSPGISGRFTLVLASERNDAHRTGEKKINFNAWTFTAL